MTDREPQRQAIAEVLAEYAMIERLPTSPGEQAVAASLVARLRTLGLPARVEPTPATSSYALPIGLLSGIGAAAGVITELNRWVGAVLAVLAAIAIADDVAGGRRWFRRVAVPRRHAYNVVAETGDPRGIAPAMAQAPPCVLSCRGRRSRGVCHGAGPGVGSVRRGRCWSGRVRRRSRRGCRASGYRPPVSVVAIAASAHALDALYGATVITPAGERNGSRRAHAGTARFEELLSKSWLLV